MQIRHTHAIRQVQTYKPETIFEKASHNFDLRNPFKWDGRPFCQFNLRGLGVIPC